MRPEETFDFQIRKGWISLSKMYNDLVQPHGITTSVGFALLNIDVKKGTPSTALGPKMGMEPTSLSRMLKSMEKQGLVFKEANPLDKRSVLIKLTEEGVHKRNLSREAVLQFNQAVQAVVGEEQRSTFFETLDKIQGITQELRLSKEEL
ncbi:MAG: MarR family winged helix-turn-helix transcriptional regulator [Schleiferiaceae bacterium]|nr:MAG: Organic hydroperoxide resistance transcriptional regulator [Cryomorphaceae bacterium]